MKLNEVLCCEDCLNEAKETVKDIPLFKQKQGEYMGQKVTLYKPQRGGPKKFFVYVENDNGRVVKVTFGDPNATIKNHDEVRAKSFQARHRCDQQKDKTTPAFWSCNVANYAKSLGLLSNRPW